MVDGPSADIVTPSGLGLSIARAGTGGLVYLKRVAGIPHVFVSQLAGGAFQPPVQVDAGLAGGSSQPVIAAGNGGLLLTAFINGGELYVVDRPSQTATYKAPTALAPGSNPSISITNLAKAYIAFTVPDGGGYDVRSAYYVNGSWTLEAAPLNAVAADDAGTGSGRPAVAAAGDGVAIVVWGENGHIYSRRVWGTSPSVAYEQADAPPSGCTEGSADQPVVGAGGDSSYAPVAFREMVTCGGRQQSRVFMNRLHASIYDGVTEPDGLSGAPADGADDPQLAVGEYGAGWVTSERTVSHAVFAGQLGNNGSLDAIAQINSLGNAAAPYPVPAFAGLYSTLIAWQQAPGSTAGAEIRVRYAPDGETLNSETVLSSPGQGPTDAADGIAAAGDVSGDAAVAWLQGTPGASQVTIAQLYQPPGPFPALKTFQYATTSQPAFGWKAPHEPWGPMKFVLSVDGNQVGQTYSTSLQVASPISDGPHSWQVTGSNPAGQQSQSRPASVFVDTVAPLAAVRLFGRPLVGSRLHVFATYVDRPPSGEPRSDASGVAKVIVHWGDGTVTALRLGSHRDYHAYRRPGRYEISLIVSDRAGNVSKELVRIKVSKPGQKSTRSHTKPGSKPGSTKPGTTKPGTGGATVPRTKRLRR